MHIFQTEKFDTPTLLKNKFPQFMAGMKHTVAKEMQERGMTYEEEKFPMGFPVFKRPCQLMSVSGLEEHMYARC